jgi:hypothetical protein
MLTTQTTSIIVAIGALVVPPIVSLLKHVTWSAQVKQLIAGVLSLGIAALGLWLVDPKDFGLPFAELGGLVYAGSQIIYGAYFKNSSVDTILTKALHKTTTATKKAA